MQIECESKTKRCIGCASRIFHLHLYKSHSNLGSGWLAGAAAIASAPCRPEDGGGRRRDRPLSQAKVSQNYSERREVAPLGTMRRWRDPPRDPKAEGVTVLVLASTR
jgi:hypothetical protein